MEPADAAEEQKARAEKAERDLAEARAQLAALHAAARAVRWGLDPDEPQFDHAPNSSGGGWRDIVYTLDGCLADLATAAAEHDRRVRAPVEAERDEARVQLAALREASMPFLEFVERAFPTIADHEASGPRVGEIYRRPDGGTMQVVEIKRGSWRSCVYRSETGETHERAHHPSWTRVVDAREARIRADERAKALREAADVCEREATDCATATGSYIAGRCEAKLRAMADEAEKGGERG